MLPTAHVKLRRNQVGQALPLGLAFMLGATLLLLVLFNTGEMVPEKTQVANTADAAVYSGLVWQARTLNFTAYTNRAMVANQVSIAQLVSLGSWTNYGRISADHLDDYTGWIPYWGSVTEVIKEVMTGIEEVMAVINAVAIPLVDGVTQVLSATQEAIYNMSFIAMPEVVKTVVEKNDDRYQSSSAFSIAAMAQNARAWQNLSERYSGDDDEMARKGDIINASLDVFSSDRGWKENPPGIPGVEIIKEGTTRLVQDGDDWEWRGKDGLSLHIDLLFTTIELPVSWGGNYAEGDGACGGNACSRWFDDNRRAERQADNNAEELDGYTGVKAYRSLKELGEDNRDPRIRLHVEVYVDDADVRTAQKIDGLGSPAPAANGMKSGIDPGMFYTDDTFAGGAMASLSSGEVFFKRPVFSDADKLNVGGKAVTEYANLFNPYWDVRLINVSDRQRQLAWGIRSPALGAGAAAEVISTQAAAAATDAGLNILEENTGISGEDLSQYQDAGEQVQEALESSSIKDQIEGLGEIEIPDSLQQYQP